MMSNLTTSIEKLSRLQKQLIVMVVDVFSLLLAIWLAYVLRLGTLFVPNEQQLFLFFLVPLIAIPVFIKMGLYRSVIRYVGEYILWTIMTAITIVMVTWSALAFFLELTGIEGLPRSIPILFWLLAAVFVPGSRFGARWLLWNPLKKRFSGRQILIYGAGTAGCQIATTLRQGRDLFPAGFLDDDTSLQGKDIAGLRVYSPTSLPVLIERFGIKDVIVSVPAASKKRQSEIVTFLEEYKVKVRILPAITDIANGKHLVNMLRSVEISDLLGRDTIPASPELLEQCINRKNVLVTGAGGSIGSELCRQIVRLNPYKIILFDISEYCLYKTEKDLLEICQRRNINCQIVARLGSVQNKQSVLSILEHHNVHTLYHAAAYKHVPLVEDNPVEGIENNVFGTLNTALAAKEAKVERFVLVSTDKAVRPTNVMGASKRLAELCIQALAENDTKTIFSMVRFGNVLGSSGSVVPLFQKQIKDGGPITVTHPDIIRYFMTIPEASQLVIQAGAMSTGGDVFLLDMGEPVKIVELAKHMIRLSGLEVKDDENPDGDISIEFTGLRPGEKLYEELLIDSQAKPTAHPRIYHAHEKKLSWKKMQQVLVELKQFCDDKNKKAIYKVLEQTVSGYSHPESEKTVIDNVIKIPLDDSKRTQY
jgi:FlaA1/EpsC-like NDP-sugar epimerase